MAARPYVSLGTSEVFRKAELAARKGDARTFDDCLAELRSRKRGEELIEQLTDLKAEMSIAEPPPPITKGFRTGDLTAFAIVTDDDCHSRLDLLRQAERSVWLSTYSIKDGSGELRQILAERVRKGVTVNLIVSPKPIKAGGHAEEVVDDLRKSGVRVTVKTNHSKCVVVDSVHVMVGSCNLQDVIYRDVGVRFSAPTVAKLLIEYLEQLVRSPA
jgi:phosphatidylserine/phosphatidylglycerophosphate/cardiolipin synthase-like enzyme